MISDEAATALADIGLEPADLTPEAIGRVEAAVPRVRPDPAKLATSVPRSW